MQKLKQKLYFASCAHNNYSSFDTILRSFMYRLKTVALHLFLFLIFLLFWGHFEPVFALIESFGVGIKSINFFIVWHMNYLLLFSKFFSILILSCCCGIGFFGVVGG